MRRLCLLLSLVTLASCGELPSLESTGWELDESVGFVPLTALLTLPIESAALDYSISRENPREPLNDWFFYFHMGPADLSQVENPEAASFLDVMNGEEGLGTDSTVWIEIPAVVLGAPVRFECPTNNPFLVSREVEYHLGGGVKIRCTANFIQLYFTVSGLGAPLVGEEGAIGFSASGETYFHLDAYFGSTPGSPGRLILRM